MRKLRSSKGKTFCFTASHVCNLRSGVLSRAPIYEKDVSAITKHIVQNIFTQYASRISVSCLRLELCEQSF